MTGHGSTRNRFGLELDNYLFLEERESYWSGAPPSIAELRRAVYSVYASRTSSFRDLETILAMEWTAACAQLGLLLAAEEGILHACVQSIMFNYMSGEGALDHAAGLLCLRVIALVVQVAILYQTNEFGPFLAAAAKRPDGQSIPDALSGAVNRLIYEVIVSGKRSATSLLGWHKDPDVTGMSCLPQVGGPGCNIVSTDMLVQHLGAARAKFLHAAKHTINSFPQLGSLFYVI